MPSPSTDTLVRTPAIEAAPPVAAPPVVAPAVAAPPLIGCEPAVAPHQLGAVQPEFALEPAAQPEVAPEPAAHTGPTMDGARLIRFRVATDHRGLHLRTGEAVLCVPYEPAELGMVVLVRCESDGHAPGALLSVHGLVYVEEAGRYSAEGGWDEPGTRVRPEGRAAHR